MNRTGMEPGLGMEQPPPGGHVKAPSQKMAGAPKVYTGEMATAGMTPRRRYIIISSVARLPPNECPCALNGNKVS